MVNDILSDFKIKIDISCKPTKSDLCNLTSYLSSEFREIFLKFCPDFVFVQGDTSTAFVAALCAFYLKIPVGHIEAGLRTYDIQLPFPEESHRRCIAAVSSLHFAPSLLAKKQLIQEGICPSKIYMSGNTIVDAIHEALAILNKTPSIVQKLIHVMQSHGLNDISQSKYFLITCHRREHWQEPLKNVVSTIIKLANKYPNYFFIWPVHSNPIVKDVVCKALKPLNNCIVLQSLSYLNFVYLMKHSSCIVTDSGGIQEEAPTILKPVFLLRNKTERPECLGHDLVKLIGTSPSELFQTLESHIKNPVDIKPFKNPFGNGKAASFIIHKLNSYFKLS